MNLFGWLTVRQQIFYHTAFQAHKTISTGKTARANGSVLGMNIWISIFKQIRNECSKLNIKYTVEQILQHSLILEDKSLTEVDGEMVDRL